MMMAWLGGWFSNMGPMMLNKLRGGVGLLKLDGEALQYAYTYNIDEEGGMIREILKFEICEGGKEGALRIYFEGI